MIATFIGALFGALLISNSAHACTKSEDFLEIGDTEKALKLTACDPIGSLYLDGLSGDRFFSFRETQQLEDRHVFYGFARAFLHSLAAPSNEDSQFEDFDSAYANLMMSVYLTQTTGGVGVDRRKAYSAYAKFAYAQFAELRGTGQSMLISAIDEELVGSSLTNRRELHCFVLHDMPHIPSEQIVASTAFKSCVTTEK